jgi:hypothetical protein
MNEMSDQPRPEQPETTTSDTPPARPVNKRLVVLVATAAALVIGSLTPWVSIIGIGLSGVSIHYGYVSLVAGALTALWAYLSTRSTTTKVMRGTTAAVALTALASAASAIYVGWAIRSSFADDGDADNEFAQAFADAFRPGLGFGLWLVLAAAVVAVVLATPVALDRVVSARTLGTTAGLVVLVLIGGIIGADQKAKADHRHAVAVAKAKAAAEEKAEAERQAAEEAAEAAREQAEAEAEAAAEAAEAVDREKYSARTTTCQIDEYGSTTVKGTLKNLSSKSRTYTVTVRLLSRAGRQVDTATDYISDLPAGETAEWSGFGWDEAIKTCSSPTVEVSEY